MVIGDALINIPYHRHTYLSVNFNDGSARAIYSRDCSDLMKFILKF